MEKRDLHYKSKTIFYITSILLSALATPGLLAREKEQKPVPVASPTPTPTPLSKKEKKEAERAAKLAAQAQAVATPTPAAMPLPKKEKKEKSAVVATPTPEAAKSATNSSTVAKSAPTPVKPKPTPKPTASPVAASKADKSNAGLAQPQVLETVDLIAPADVTTLVVPVAADAENAASASSTTTSAGGGEPVVSTTEEKAADPKTGDEEVDLIPLPVDVEGDAQLLDLPMNDGLLPAGDIPPLNAPMAVTGVPTEESERVLTARYKALLTKTEKDPKLVGLWQLAQKAKTYEDSRAAKREYYRLLFSMMRKADKTLNKRINAMERAYLERLSQTRIEPTIPLSPPPKVEPLQ